MKQTKRVAVIADMHCGSEVGLTPDSWQKSASGVYLDKTKIAKFENIRKQCWDFYSTNIRLYRPDILIVNGDCIDGNGVRSGGTEELEINRDRQCSMAAECIMEAKADKIIITYGTGYHTSSDGEDWENIVAQYVKAEKIGSHEWVNVNGLVFDVKHHIGSSSVPYGRHAAIARDHYWNILWSERNEQPKSDIFIRSHVHYYNYSGGKNFLGITTPALQSLGTKFGSRICSGTVDFGFLIFEVSPNGDYTWKPILANLVAHQAKAIIV